MKFKNNLKLLNEVASADSIEEDDSEISSLEIKIDFDPEIDKQVYNVIKEVHNTSIEEVKDLHPITVSFKDNSVYAYAPRRFAKRQQIREIIDDLLTRSII